MGVSRVRATNKRPSPEEMVSLVKYLNAARYRRIKARHRKAMFTLYGKATQ